jgi:hypothetical protein
MFTRDIEGILITSQVKNDIEKCQISRDIPQLCWTLSKIGHLFNFCDNETHSLDKKLDRHSC